MTLYTGDSINDNSSFKFGNSRLLSSSSFGDSLQRGLISEIGYVYDDLDGGFQYDLNSHINLSSKGAPSISLSNELNSLSNSLNTSLINNHKNNFDQDPGSFSINHDLKTSLSIGTSSVPVQNFFELNSDLYLSLIHI